MIPQGFTEIEYSAYLECISKIKVGYTVSFYARSIRDDESPSQVKTPYAANAVVVARAECRINDRSNRVELVLGRTERNGKYGFWVPPMSISRGPMQVFGLYADCFKNPKVMDDVFERFKTFRYIRQVYDGRIAGVISRGT